jgi:hypothetical protein
MKLIICFILLSFNATAVDNAKVAIQTNDSLVMHKSNNQNIVDITTKNTSLSSVVDAYQTCSNKGKIYLGTGAADVDSDNCYDVTNTTNPQTQFRPVFAGFLSGGNYNFYSGGNNSSLIGRFGADNECSSQYAGSRAMVFEDLKYVLPTLNLPANIDTTPVWVYDTVKSYNNASTNTVLSKNAEAVQQLFDCNGWNANSTATKGSVLLKTTSGANTYFKVDNQTCNTNAYIACIYN